MVQVREDDDLDSNGDKIQSNGQRYVLQRINGTSDGLNVQTEKKGIKDNTLF